MTGEWVVDSSVGFAWVHPQQATPETDTLLEDVGAGATVVVPELWFAKMANGLLALQRRKRLTAHERKTALRTLAGLSLIVDEEAGKMAFGRTSELAEKHGLSVYDATYLEIALRRKLSLASRDNALRQAAKRCGVKVL